MLPAFWIATAFNIKTNNEMYTVYREEWNENWILDKDEINEITAQQRTGEEHT